MQPGKEGDSAQTGLEIWTLPSSTRKSAHAGVAFSAQIRALYTVINEGWGVEGLHSIVDPPAVEPTISSCFTTSRLYEIEKSDEVLRITGVGAAVCVGLWFPKSSEGKEEEEEEEEEGEEEEEEEEKEKETLCSGWEKWRWPPRTSFSWRRFMSVSIVFRGS